MPRQLSQAQICQEFRANPTVNPRTRRRITIGSAVHAALQRECGSPRQSPQRAIPRQAPQRAGPRQSPRRAGPVDCQEFRANPTVNPRTRRRITIGSAVHAALQRECASPRQSPRRAVRNVSLEWIDALTRPRQAPQRAIPVDDDWIQQMHGRIGDNYQMRERPPPPRARRQSPRRPINSLTEAECDAWRQTHLVDPRTDERIETHATYERIRRKCGNPIGWAPSPQRAARPRGQQPITEEDCYKWNEYRTTNPHTFNDMPEGSPNYLRWAKKCTGQGIEDKLGLNPMSRADKLADLERHCSDMHDAISLEEFADMSDRDLARVVKIGPANQRKHCYSVDSLKPHLREKFTDPLNPSYKLNDMEHRKILNWP